MRACEYVARHSGLYKPTVLEHEHALAVSGHDAQVVRNQKQRRIFTKLLEQLQNLCLNRDIQCCRRLIGDEQLRLGNERGSDHRALSHSPGKLMRVGAILPLGIGQAYATQHVYHARLCLRAPGQFVLNQYPLKLSANANIRIQRQRGILKHHGDAPGAKAVQLRFPRAEHLDTSELHAAAHVRVAGQQAKNGQRCLCFSRPGLTDEANGLTARNGKAQLVYRGLTRVIDRQAFDVEQAHRNRLESNTSRRASPRKLKHIRISASNAAGISSIQEAPSIWLTPASTSAPREVCGS